MKCLFLRCAFLALTASGFCAEPARLLEKAPALPLAIDDAFEFRKTKTFLNDPKFLNTTTEPMLNFERARINFGAVTQYDRVERYGNYFTFFWRSARSADLIMRLEYRQENLGTYVQAQEKAYSGVKGSMKSEFQVIGDDYRQDGKVTAWRAVLIENGKIVALNQSFLWN